MSESPAAPEENSATSEKTLRPHKRGTWFVLGSIVFILAMLLYMEKTPRLLHWPIRILFFGAVAWLVYAAIRKIVTTKFEPKKIVFSLVLTVILYGVLHVFCIAFIKLMAHKDSALTTVKTTSLSEKARRGVGAVLDGDSPSLYDRDIGWVPRPDYEWKMHKIGPQGFRGTRVYPEAPPDPEKRFICTGDSFTFGYEVEDDESYPHHAEQMVPGTEWINLGICGGGLTQSLLHYRKNGKKFGGKTVIIGFMTNNNKRTVNCYRGFVSPDDAMTPLTKPYAKINRAGNFSIEPNPYQDVEEYRKLLADEPGELQRLYDLDYFTWSNQKGVKNPIVRTLRYIWDYRYGERNLNVLLNRDYDPNAFKFRPGDDPYGRAIWHPESLGFRANATVFDLYYNEVIADGKEPLIVILPSAKDVEDRAAGRPAKHATLLAHFDREGYRYLDFLDSLEVHRKDRMTKEDLYGRTHLNAESNKLVAEELVRVLGLSQPVVKSGEPAAASNGTSG